jgi:cyanoexosortase A
MNNLRPSFWLGLTGLGLIALHLTLTWKLTQQTDQMVLNVLFWGAIASLLWQRRSSLNLNSDWISSTIASVIMGLVLMKSLSLFWFESPFVRLFPGLAALSLGLLASGPRLSQYWREGLMVLTLMIPGGALSQILEPQIGVAIQTLLAQTITFLLHYTGMDVMRRGTEIVMSNGAVRVEYGCTGIPILILLIQLSILLVLLFPMRGYRQSYIFGIASTIAFALGVIRITIMSLVVNQRPVFEFWHGPPGAQIFSTLAIALFALCSQALITPGEES